MAWTTPATVTTAQLMTAAFWNTQVRDNLGFLAGSTAASNDDSRTFTNTARLDLDALTGGAGTIGAIAVSLDTGTEAIVIMSAFMAVNTLGATVTIGYKVSGATTIAGAGSMQHESGAISDLDELSWMGHEKGLTPGANTFEMQASVSAGTGDLRRPRLAVIPLI